MSVDPLKPESSETRKTIIIVFLAIFLLTVGNPKAKGCNLGYVPLNEYQLVIND